VKRVVGLAVVVGCSAAPSPPVEVVPVAAVAPPDSSSAPAVSSAPPPPPSPTAALDAELAALRACPTGSSSYDVRCPAQAAFLRELRVPQTVAEEGLLLSLALGAAPMRYSAIVRLAVQPGPRTVDPRRALSFIEAARAAEGRDRAEAKWLGRALGAVTFETPEVREALRSLATTSKSDVLVAEAITGVGIAHPHDAVALDWVDSFLGDPRGPVKHGVIDAYAETSKRDDRRACATWARFLSDEAVVVRAAALISVTPACSAQHAAVLAIAEKRLAKDPTDGTHLVLGHLCEGPEKKALAPRVLALATRLVPKQSQGTWEDPLRAVGICDPRGPEKALAPYVKKPGELGFAAQRVLSELTTR
jgi:hypothetical protein